MKPCKVHWCLDEAVRYGLCPLHLAHRVKNDAEERDAYFSRLRTEEGVGKDYRRRLRTPDRTRVRLFEKDGPVEPGVAQPGFSEE